jgi:hypothetical protein
MGRIQVVAPMDMQKDFIFEAIVDDKRVFVTCPQDVKMGEVIEGMQKRQNICWYLFKMLHFL